MRKTFALINQTCRTAARVLSDSHERALTRLERVGLAIHLMGCGNCRKYQGQLHLLQACFKAKGEQVETAERIPPDARDRIIANVKRAVE